MTFGFQLQLSVKARVIEALRQFPATVRELEADGCGAQSSIRRALRAIAVDGSVVLLPGRRYALRAAERYTLL